MDNGNITWASYYWTITKIAATNTVARTGISASVGFYLVVSPVLGLLAHFVIYGLDATAAQWPSLLAFALCGPVVAWCVVFIACCVSAGPEFHNQTVQAAAKAASEARTQINGLQSEKEALLTAHPQMVLQFEENNECYKDEDGGFRVVMTTDSDLRTVQSARLLLTEVSLLGVPDGSESQVLPESPLPIVISGPSHELHGGDRIPILTVSNRGSGYSIGGEYPGPGFLRLLQGRYRITLMASGQNAKPATLKLIINRDATGMLNCVIDKSLGQSATTAHRLRLPTVYEPIGLEMG